MMNEWKVSCAMRVARALPHSIPTRAQHETVAYSGRCDDTTCCYGVMARPVVKEDCGRMAVSRLDRAEVLMCLQKGWQKVVKGASDERRRSKRCRGGGDKQV